MTSTNAEFLRSFVEACGLSPGATLNTQRALRAANLSIKPSKGRGHEKTKITPADASNLILAQAASQASEAAQVVKRLRSMPFMTATSGQSPYFGDLNFGEVFDLIVESRRPAEAYNCAITHVTVSTQPYRAVIFWIQENGLSRSETYADRDGSLIYAIRKLTFIEARLFSFTSDMLREVEKEAAASPGREATAIATQDHDAIPGTCQRQCDSRSARLGSVL